MGLFDFLKPAWQSQKPQKALKAVAKETNPKQLAKIAKNAPLYFVRKAAIEKLTDRTLLAEVAQSNPHNVSLLMAVSEKLGDQKILADIACQPERPTSARLAALDKLTDSALARKVFAEIMQKAEKSDDSNTRMEAVRLLTTQNLLADLAQNDPDFAVREAAAAKLTDQAVLAQVAQKDSFFTVRLKAVAKLTDQELLFHIAKMDQEFQVREAAVAQLTDQAALIQIAKLDVALPIREAAAKKLTDRWLAQDILAKIATEKNKNLAAAHKGGGLAAGSDADCANEPLSYDEFVNSVKSFMNIREFGKVQTAIEKLTNRNILSEIIKSTAAGWYYDRGQDNFGPYHIVDLRDTARMRLEKLEKNKIPAKPPVQRKAPENAPGPAVIEDGLMNIDPNRKPNNDLTFIAHSLKNAPTALIKGLIDGLVVMTPGCAKTIQKFPAHAERLYQIGLSSLMGIEALNLIRNPSLPSNTQYYGTVVIHSGFPQVCLKCRKPVEKFELLMASVHNEEGIQGRVSMTAENSQEIFDVLNNVRHFIAVPCCAEHSLADRFFFWTGPSPFFTDDEDIAATCRIYLNQPQSFEQPVKVLQGKIVPFITPRRTN